MKSSVASKALTTLIVTTKTFENNPMNGDINFEPLR